MNARRLQLWAQLLVGGALLLAVWALLVWASARPALKRLIDLTPQQVNTVDPATEELLRDLRSRKAELELHLLYPSFAGQAPDDRAAQIQAIRGRVRELTRQLLTTYQYLGGESVTVHAHDFYADVATTREAVQRFDYKGSDDDVLVVALRMPGKELRFRKLSLLLDLAEIGLPNTGAGPMQGKGLPVLKRYYGERQISSALKQLLTEGTPVAYLLRDYSPLLDTVLAVPHGYNDLLAQLDKQGFEGRVWRPLQQPQVPDDAALVIVLEPEYDFSDAAAQALFDYVKRGGRLFLNFSWVPTADRQPDGGKLAELLGYELTQVPVFHKIVERNRTGGAGLDGDVAVTRLQMQVTNHPTTRRFAESGRPLEIAYARGVRVRPGASPAIRREALLRTGRLAWLARIEGGRPSYLQGGAPLGEFDVAMTCEVDVAPDPRRPDAPKVGQVVLVAGLFCNNAGMPMFGDFALNICNWLTARRTLLDFKTPGYEAKFLQLQPQQIDRIGWLLEWWVPGTLLAVGSFVLWRRRQ